VANLCAFGLDMRLRAAATTVGAAYTRYADDLAFSGDRRFAEQARRFHGLVCEIALTEGFQVHTRKTRFMRAGTRQRLAGLIVNRRPNVLRAEWDELKAILTNCERDGPESQNRGGVADFEAHLRGRITWVAQVHPQRGARLRKLFDRIPW
jgi:hypothetical protein